MSSSSKEVDIGDSPGGDFSSSAYAISTDRSVGPAAGGSCPSIFCTKRSYYKGLRRCGMPHAVDTEFIRQSRPPRQGAISEGFWQTNVPPPSPGQICRRCATGDRQIPLPGPLQTLCAHQSSVRPPGRSGAPGSCARLTRVNQGGAAHSCKISTVTIT